MFWPEYTASAMAKCDESVHQKVEETRNYKLDLFGRHPFVGQQPTGSTKPFTNHAARCGGSWNGSKPKEVQTNPNPTGGTFGFYGGPKKGIFASTPRKDEEHKERIGKTFNSFRNELQKNGSNTWCHKKFSDGNAFFKGFHRPIGPICKPTGTNWLGQESASPFSFATASKGNEYLNGGMERKKFSGKDPSEGTSFRFLTGGMGWGRCNQWKFSPGILERQKELAHKSERV